MATNRSSVATLPEEAYAASIRAVLAQHQTYAQQLYSETVRDCVEKNGTLSYYGEFHTHFSILTVDQGQLEVGGFCWIRWTIRAEVGTVVQIQNSVCKNAKATMTIYELNSTIPHTPVLKRLVDVCDGVGNKNYLGETNDILMFVKMKRAPSISIFHVDIQQRSLDVLEVQHVTENQGHVQVPRHGAPSFPRGIHSTVYINIPRDHDVMTSFKNVFLSKRARLIIRTTEDSLWFTGKPQNYLFRAKLFPNWEKGQLVVSLMDGVPYDNTLHSLGFKLQFTFHQHTALPQQNPETGVWNCSVPHWPQFQVHLACNLWVQCHGGRDEDGCNYTRCAASGFSVSGRCYLLSRETTGSALDAHMSCAAMGARLAVLALPEVMKEVDAVLWTKFTIAMYVGLQSHIPGLPSIYNDMLVWSDMTVSYQASKTEQRKERCRPCCASLLRPNRWSLNDALFDLNLNNCFRDSNLVNSPVFSLCEKKNSESKEKVMTQQALQLQALNTNVSLITPAAVVCPAGHFTQCFLAIDSKASCWKHKDIIGERAAAALRGQDSSLWRCSGMLTAVPVHFVCGRSSQRLPFTLVCDHRQDCWDNSDEDFCHIPSCTGSTSLQCAASQQETANGISTTTDSEAQRLQSKLERDMQMNPDIFYFDENGGKRLTHSLFKEDFDDDLYKRTCPDTHFKCPVEGYCLPAFVRCNGVYDCSGKEDEEGCETAVCSGYYRCRGSTVCLHPDHVCDGLVQCPQRDDELLCGLVCPRDCICLGLAFKCSTTSQFERFPHCLRALDMSGTNTTVSHLVRFVMLVYLDLQMCNLVNISGISFSNVLTLILSKNFIRVLGINDLKNLPNLRHLHLSQNPITTLFSKNTNTSLTLPSVTSLDLSIVHLSRLDVSVFGVFPNLQSLNLSESGVEHVLDSGNHSLSKLQVIDTRGCAVLEFPPRLFLEMDSLQTLYGDTDKLCCPQVLPAGFNPSNCHTPVNEISSCDNLLRSNAYRLFLALFAALALSGNAISLLLRMRTSKARKESGYSVFVTHLCMSDGLMGVYLVIIGVADRLYQNTYLWQDIAWRNSVVCKTAGFLALASMEMSAFIICLITLDRFLVIRFPFSQLRFQRGSAHVACCVLWAVVIVIVSIPFFPAYTHWGFYSHTDICIPLPITRSSFAGHSYAFGVMIVVNMALFLAIAVGQTAIYAAIRSNTMTSTDSNRKQQDLNIALRLVTIAATDFLCWFPVGLLGLLASTGIAVPGEVNVAMATLVIPLNSAMNPVLYTMNVVLEKRRHAREERIFKYIMSLSP